MALVSEDETMGTFEEFFQEAEPRLRRALSAAYGVATGREAAIEALAWAWEHWDRVAGMANPVGYLYRVGQTEARRLHIQPSKPIVSSENTTVDEPEIEPALERALASLSEAQRTAVVLVHAFEWTYQEVADLVGASRSSVQTHLERGLRRLRVHLEVRSHG
jgi:RNA polymerase sigma factor (sigma-70 family)